MDMQAVCWREATVSRGSTSFRPKVSSLCALSEMSLPVSGAIRPDLAAFRPEGRASRPGCGTIDPDAGSPRTRVGALTPSRGPSPSWGREPRTPGRTSPALGRAPRTPGRQLQPLPKDFSPREEGLSSRGRKPHERGRMFLVWLDAGKLPAVFNPRSMRKRGLTSSRSPNTMRNVVAVTSCCTRGMCLSGLRKEVRNGYVVREPPLSCAAPARDGWDVVKQKQREKRAKP